VPIYEHPGNQPEIHIGETPPVNGNWIRETDTFDTWFLSSQWPITTLGFPDSEDFKYFYPTSVLDTLWDILFFWVARMMMIGLYRTGEVPFRVVHLHSRVVDAKGQKMSKSRGNVLNPIDLVDKYGADAVRYFLLKEIPTTEDGDMTKERMADIYSSELANGLGNLVARVAAIAEKNFTEIVVSDDAFKENVELVWKKYAENIENYKFNDALQNIFSLVREGNTYIDREKPWEGDNAKNVIPNVVYLIINIGWLLMPFMPDTAEKILKQYGVDINDGKAWEKQKPHVVKGESLFPRI